MPNIHPIVENSAGGGTPFSEDRFAGGLIRAGVSADAALRAASLVHGLLLGSGRSNVSTDALRSVAAEILANPSTPDAATLRRLVTRVDGGGPSPAQSIPQLYRSIALAAAGARATVPESPVVLCYSSVCATDGSQADQYLALGRDGRGNLHEFGCGADNFRRRLGRAFPEEAVDATRTLRTPAEILRTLASVHPAWANLEAPGVRSIALVARLPTGIASLRALEGGAAYLAVANSTSGCTVAILNAATGALAWQAALSVEQLPSVLTIRPDLSSFGDWFQLLGKVLAALALLEKAAALVGVGVLGSETVVLPILAGLLLALLIVGIGILLARIIMELDLADEATTNATVDRYKRLREILEKLLRDFEAGNVSEDEAKRRLREALEELERLKDAAKADAARGGDAAKDAGTTIQIFERIINLLRRRLG